MQPDWEGPWKPCGRVVSSAFPQVGSNQTSLAGLASGALAGTPSGESAPRLGLSPGEGSSFALMRLAAPSARGD